MYPFLLLVGVIATLVGLFAIGVGLTPYEGSLGNAYLIAGAVGVVGGVILLALAATVRDLRRIADALAPRGAAARRQAPAEALDGGPAQRPVPAPPPAARIPYPPRPGADQREARAADQREARFERPPGPPAPPQPPVEAPEPPPPRERPRPQAPPRVGGEPPMMEEEHEEVPLAPGRVPASQMRAPPPVAEPPLPPEPPRPAEPRPTQADIMARLSNLASTPPRPAPRPEPPRAPAPPPPPAERQNDRQNERQNERASAPADQRRPNMFDALWPAEVRAARQSQSETIARAPRFEPRPEQRPEPRPEQRPEPRSEPRADLRPEPRLDVQPRGGPPMPPPTPREPMPREPAPREPAPREPTPREPPPAEPRTIAILKSGVIDGMAYTLYTDGSIEAELPQGTMRFASIDDLRSHLENSDRPA